LSYSKNYDFIPLPSRYLFWLALPIIHHRDTIVPNRPWPSPQSFTVTLRSPPFPTVLKLTVGNGQERSGTVGNGGERWRTMRDGQVRLGTIVSRWWTECHHGSRWPENSNGTVTVTGQNHNFYCIWMTTHFGPFLA